MTGTMLTSDSILNRLTNREVRVGIGVGADKEKVELSKQTAERFGFKNISVYDDAVALATDLKAGRIDAAVRGDLGSNDAMAAVRKAFGVDKVLRAAFMEPSGGRMFLLAPVGIDEGWSVDEKIELAVLGNAVLSKMGISPVIGIMSGGRASDKGRMEEIDRTIDIACEVVKTLRSQGIDARDVQILIEDAAKECDMVIAPDGISGNLIFRTLHFLGGGKALGAPILNIDRVYIDTSRAKQSYFDSIVLAASMAPSVRRR
jgi:putative methanogen marker protein 4